MELKTQIKILGMLYRLAGSRDVNFGDTSSTVKPRFKAEKQRDGGFAEALPEQVGVRSEGLLKMFAQLSSDSEICPHSIIVLRGGRLIAKADWKPFSSRFMHVSHSLCKSVVSMAAGIAVKEKYLSEEEKIADIFADESQEISDKKMKLVTVRHLLTMSSGVKFNEAGALTSENWTKNFLASEVMFDPGSRFNYNSMNTYMLSAAICLRTGLSLSEYLNRRLFTPMGITDFYWEKSPEGIEKGGWGLYMSVYDYAKLGQLYLEGGVWNGVRLIPEEWVKKSASKQISGTDDPCRDGYGYQIWRTKHGNGFVFSGMFGQNVFVFPSRKIVIAMTAGSSNLFPPCKAMDIVTGFIENKNNFSNSPIKDFRYANAALLRNALAGASFGKPLTLGGKASFFERLRKSLSHTGTGTDAVPEAARILNGAEVVFEKNRAGLLPVLIQVMNGNFGGGIEKAVFEVGRGETHPLPSYKRFISPLAVYGGDGGGKFSVRFESGGKRFRVPVSFTEKPAYFDLETGGDSFKVGVNGSLITDEDGLPVLKIVMCFVETSCAKILKFVFGYEGVILKIRESPQLYGALDEAAEMVMPSLGKAAGKAVETILETDIAEYKIKSFLEPTLKGKLVPLQNQRGRTE